MITFSPIQKLIQETLHQKMKMLDKVPSNQTGINEPTTKDGGVPQENYMFARSVFLRMTSLLTRNNKPIVLMGGELFEGQYRKGLDVYGPKSGGVREENPNLRPMAGVKDVNVEYPGGGMKIGALRKTSISWTCWTWEELQKFKPFFLTHGKHVLIEFGWGFQGYDAPDMLPIIKENGEINDDLINGTEESDSLQERIPEYILEQKGHYDAVLGKIDNFEFSVNETGGFDCTTSLVSMGVNTMNKMDSKESVTGNLVNLPIAEPKNTGHLWWKDKDFLVNQSKDKNPYYSFKSYMMSLEGHLHLNALNSKGSIAYILGGDAPYCTWGWFEDNVLSRFAGQINANKNKIISEFRSIENIYNDEGKQIDVQPTLMRVSIDVMPTDFKDWLWISPEQVSDDENFWKDQSLNQDKSKLIPGTRVNDRNNGRDLGDFKLMFAPPYAQGNQSFETGYMNKVWKKTFLGSEDATWNDDGAYFRPFKNSENKNGVIRNIYFGHEFLTECFDKSTIKEGIESVWSKFSAAYGGIYDFKIQFDDKEGRLMIKDDGFTNKKVHKVLENTSKNPNSVVYDNKGVFVFPIWEKNSIVKNQNLSAKIPNRMQLQAMYGTNNPKFGDGELDDLKDWGALLLGRNEMETYESEYAKKELLDSLVGDIESPFRRVDGGQMTFGNASADDNKPLQWKGNTSSDTTGIYEDLSNEGLKNKENDTFGQGINEVMENDLKIEFSKRLLRAAGLDDNVEAPAEVGIGQKLANLIGVGEDDEKSNKITTTLELKTAQKNFRNAKTESDGMKKIYDWDSPTTSGKYYVTRPASKTIGGGTGLLVLPKMSLEYQAMMKMALKGPKTGLLKQSNPLIPIELEIEIDGTGGIFPGNSFHSSYLPKTYMDIMCFQVIGASHKIDSTGWTTTLKGQMRVGVRPSSQIDRSRDLNPDDLLSSTDEITDDGTTYDDDTQNANPLTDRDIKTAMGSDNTNVYVNPLDLEPNPDDSFIGPPAPISDEEVKEAATVSSLFDDSLNEEEKAKFYNQGFLFGDIKEFRNDTKGQQPRPGAKGVWFIRDDGKGGNLTALQKKYPNGMDFRNPELGVQRPYSAKGYN